MPLEAAFGDLDQIPIEPILRNSRLIPSNQQDRLALNIECECNPPHTIIGAKAKFLHVRELRSLQRIHSRPAKLRSEFSQQSSQGVNLATDGFGELPELRQKLPVELNYPLFLTFPSNALSLPLSLNHITPMSEACAPRSGHSKKDTT